MVKDRMTLPEYYDFAFQELYSLEEMLASFGQAQLADVLKSVVEMAYGKLSSLDNVMERDVGQMQVQIADTGEPERVVLAGKPKNESIH